MSSIAHSSRCYLGTATLLFLFTACASQLDQITKESQEWRRTIEQSVKATADAVDAVAKAVPGERFLRLIDDLNGPDPEKRKEAQQYLTNLTGIDVEQQYVVTVWFQFNQANTLRADVFRASSPVPEHVVERVLSRAPNLTAPVASTPLRPPTQTEMDEALDSAILQFIRTIRGQPKTTLAPATFEQFRSQPFHIGTIAWPENSLLPPLRKDYHSARLSYPEAVANFDEATHQLVSSTETRLVTSLSAVVKTLYSGRELPISSLTIQRAWPVVDNQQFLFVLIPEADWEQHKNDIVVKAVVHAKGEPNATFNHTAIYTFPLDDFRRTPVDVNGRKEVVYWATHNMTGISIFADPELTMKLARLRQTIAEWEKVQHQK